MKQELPPESEDEITAPGAPDLMCRPLDGEDESAVTGYAQAFLSEHSPAAVTNGFLVEILASSYMRHGKDIGRLVQIEDTCERAFLRSLRHLRDLNRPGKKSGQAE